MNVYRISKCQYIDDLSGTGSALFPGRWHSKGTYILYTASTAALALLESVVHISKIPLLDYCLITLEVPGDNISVLKLSDLPVNWHQHPPSNALRIIGDKFIAEKSAFMLKLPSAIIPEDHNYLINPNHDDFAKVTVTAKRKLFIDDRLLKK